MSQTTPSDTELRSTLVQLKSANQSLGISKIHALLKSDHPDWSVSEKRVKSILQSEGLVQSSNPKAATSKYPSSKVIRNLDISKWTTRTEVRYFDDKKGKGLVAKEDIKEGEVVWKEDPWVVQAEWDVYDLQMRGVACNFCTSPFPDPTSPLVMSCPMANCGARFCSRLCLSRSSVVHPLLCPAQNPASEPLVKFARQAEWMALGALANATSRLLLAMQDKDAHGKKFNEDWDVFTSFAVLGMEDRWSSSRELFGNPIEPDREQWKRAYQLYLSAFKVPAAPKSTQEKKLAKLAKKTLPADVETALFDYEKGFLKNLGRMSLNLEAHGGLYTLHSHLNHSCSPNISVRHLGSQPSGSSSQNKKDPLSRITMIAKTDIKQGEELVITYVNPSLRRRARQKELSEWGFGKCACVRCLEEEKEDGDREDSKEDKGDLERELKASFGVV